MLQGGSGGPIGRADEAVGSGGCGGLGVVRRCVDGGVGGVLSSWGVTQCWPVGAEKRLTGFVENCWL